MLGKNKSTNDVKTKDVIENNRDQRFVTKFSILIASLKFLWFVGHVIVVYNTIINTTIAKFNTNYSTSYQKALIGSIISNLVILYKTHGIPDFASSWFENICRDENFHYLVLAIIFVFNRPLFFLLYPFAGYSVFHIANFVYAEFLSSTPQSNLAIKIYNFINNYQDYVVKKIAQYEIFIAFPMVFVAAIFRQVSFLIVLIYGRFLYMRYYVSPIVRNVWKEFQNFCERKVEGNTRDANTKPLPKGVKYAYFGLERFCQDYLYPLEQLEPRKHTQIPVIVQAPAEQVEEIQSSSQPIETKN